MDFSRQEYWSGLTFPCPGDLPDPGKEPSSPILQADSLPSKPTRKSIGEVHMPAERMLWYIYKIKHYGAMVVYLQN